MAVEKIDIVLRVLETNTKALKDANSQLKNIGVSAKKQVKIPRLLVVDSKRWARI